MPVLLVVGGGLVGSPAAAYARRKGIEAVVFDAGLSGAASPAAAGLFKEEWAGRKLADSFRAALPLLDSLYGIRNISLTHDDGRAEPFLFVPPAAVIEPAPTRAVVTAVGDGWLEAEGRRYEGWVYVAAGVWCERLLPGVGVYGKAGAAYRFRGERPGRIRPVAHGRQAIAFVREPGWTYFSDGTAERDYTQAHDRATLERATGFGLINPAERCWGQRPYVPGGPLFRKLGTRLWLGTGARKMGTILGAAFARRLVDEELRARR